MSDVRASARYVGSFFIISNVVFIAGAVIFLEPFLGAADYLSVIANNRSSVVLGALLEIANAFAYLGIAVVMYPILKRRFESVAIGYVALRTLEFVMQILASLVPLLLLGLSMQFKAASGSTAGIAALGSMLLDQRMWAFHMISLTLSSGALLFYSMLLRTKLVPAFISIWGLAGAAIVLINMLAEMFGFPLPNLGYLMLANELFLGGWLIVKGFRPAAVAELTKESA